MVDIPPGGVLLNKLKPKVELVFDNNQVKAKFDNWPCAMKVTVAHGVLGGAAVVLILEPQLQTPPMAPMPPLPQ